MTKQIFGAIEFAEKEVRLIVGEFFNTRFNIIKIETEACDGLSEFVITNKDEVRRSVNEVVKKATKHIGADIERLILIIPSVNFKRYPLKVAVKTNGIVRKEDAVHAINNAMKTNVDRNILIVNAVCVKYTCNGISYRRLPEREFSDDLIVDIDLLCADKSITFDYVSILEDLGIEVLDISLDMYAICKEAALFERTVNQNLILVKVDYNTTNLALISKGKLVNCDILYNGLGEINDVVYDKYHLPPTSIDRLVKYNASVDLNERSKCAIFAWKSNDGESHTISEYDLSMLVRGSLDNLANKIKEACEPILEAGETSIVIVGEGAEMRCLPDLIAAKTGVSVKRYLPETIGARETRFSALLGSIYGYKDLVDINNNMASSVNLLKFNDLVEKKTEGEESLTFTTRIRNLFDL